MWDKGVTWALAFLALASSAGWLAGRQTRSLRRIKAESELLVHLPAGEARTALEAHLEQSTQEYLQQRIARDRSGLQWFAALALFLLGSALTLGAMASGRKDGELIGLPLVVVAAAWSVVLTNREWREVRRLIGQVRSDID